MKIFKPFLLIAISLMIISCSKETPSQDPIVGLWHFSKAVEVINDSAFTHRETLEWIGGELEFNENGDFSFSHFTVNEPPYFFTTEGSWVKFSGHYIIDYKSQFLEKKYDSVDYKNHPKVIFINPGGHRDGQQLFIQSDDKIVNGVIEEYFYREYHR